MNVYEEPLTLVCVAPVKPILSIPTLSVTTAVKVTVSLWSLVFTVIVVLLALRLLITGFWSSPFVILIVIVSVTLFPAASATVNVGVSVAEPKL